MNSVAATLAAYARQAQAQLPAEVWHYLQEGDEHARLANQAAFGEMT